MTGFRDCFLRDLISAMERTADSLEFEKLWRSLRLDDEGMPHQNHFDPVKFKHYLSRLMILEMDPAKNLSVIKLMGQKVRDRLGFDGRGLNFNDISTQQQDRAHKERQAAYHDHPVGRVAWIEVFAEGRQGALYETTYLPIRGKEGERLVYSLVIPVKMSIPFRVGDGPVNLFQTVSEIFLDLGHGVPNLSTGFDT